MKNDITMNRLMQDAAAAVLNGHDTPSTVTAFYEDPLYRKRVATAVGRRALLLARDSDVPKKLWMRPSYRAKLLELVWASPPEYIGGFVALLIGKDAAAILEKAATLRIAKNATTTSL
jgi:hypothetical protein